MTTKNKTENKIQTKTAFIALVGLPNAGKSTLLNSLIGQKVSIVSPKPQTTRDRILGILTRENHQIVFVDTPGVQKPKNALGEYMARTAEMASQDMDAILLCIDAHERGIGDAELNLIKHFAQKGAPLVIAVTKTDISSVQLLMPNLDKLNGIAEIDAIFAVSARKNRNTDALRDYLSKFLHDGEFYFAGDDVTDRGMRFIACEIIREKILLALSDEVPHGTAIELNKFELDSERGIFDVDANIYVEKQSHKGILLGKGGQMIKEIGVRARAALEKQLEQKVYLSLWVKVKENWRDDSKMLRLVGYDIGEL